MLGRDLGGQLAQARQRREQVAPPPRERDSHRRLGRRETAVNGTRDAKAARALEHDERDAGALCHRRDDPLLLGLGARQGRPRRFAADVAPDLAPRAGAVLLRPPDQRLVAQVLTAYGGSSGQAMAFGQDADERLATQVQLLQAGILERGPDKARVDLAGVELLDVEHRRAEPELEIHVGIARAEGVDYRTGDTAGQRTGEAETQPP